MIWRFFVISLLKLCVRLSNHRSAEHAVAEQRIVEPEAGGEARPEARPEAGGVGVVEGLAAGVVVVEGLAAGAAVGAAVGAEKEM